MLRDGIVATVGGLATFTVSDILLSLSGLDKIAQVDLTLFRIMLSFIAGFALFALGSGNNILTLNLGGLEFQKLLYTGLSLFVLIFGVLRLNIVQAVFQPWNELGIPVVLATLITETYILFGAGHLAVRAFFGKPGQLSLSESVLFRFVFGLFFVGTVGLFSSVTPYKSLAMPVTFALLTAIPIGILYITWKDERIREPYKPIRVSTLTVALVSCMMTLLVFATFILLSSLGGLSAFIRGDMWSTAHFVGFMENFGLQNYFASPVEGYPVWYTLTWTSISAAGGLPFINSLILIAIIDSALLIVSVYSLARVIFGNSQTGMIAAVFWCTLAGFTWLYVATNQPQSALVGQDLLNYLTSIIQHSGITSGVYYSHAYLDEETFARSLSASLSIVSIICLFRLTTRMSWLYLSVLFLTLFQITAGHLTEIPALAPAFFVSTLMLKHNQFKYLLVAASIPFLTQMGISVFAGQTIFISNDFGLIATLGPVIGAGAGILFRHWGISTFGRIVALTRAHWSLVAKPVLLLFALMILSGILYANRLFINFPIVTLWYYPAIEWGFSGLVAILAVLVLRNRINSSLVFLGSIILFSLAYIGVLNFFNANISYVVVPYPTEPFTFLPILDAVGAGALIAVAKHVQSNHALRRWVPVVAVVALVSFGSLDNVLSATYWDTYDRWYSTPPLSNNNAEFQVMNYLYANSFNRNSYSFAITNGPNDPASDVIAATGLSALSPPLENIIVQATDPREISTIARIFAVSYVVESAADPFPNNTVLAKYLNTTHPVFENIGFKVYNFTQLHLPIPVSGASPRAFLTFSNASFVGNLTVLDGNGTETAFSNAAGSIKPLSNGLLEVSVARLGYSLMAHTSESPRVLIQGNLSLSSMESSWLVFPELANQANEVTIEGNMSFGLFSAFDNRAFLDNFTYSGSYVSNPTPDFLSSKYANQQIAHYVGSNDVSILHVAFGTLPGRITVALFVVWTIIDVLVKVSRRTR